MSPVCGIFSLVLFSSFASLPPSVITSRMLLLKDRGLVECLAKPEWAQKFPLKLSKKDWVLMENVVGVLKVRIGVEAELSLHRILFGKIVAYMYYANLFPQIFHEITEQLSHSSACVSEVTLSGLHVCFNNVPIILP